MVDPRDADATTEQPVLARFLVDDAATDDGDAPARVAMQDMEQLLVERIAAVDDDRRRTAKQMLKALQTHRDDIDRRLRGQRIGLLTAVALVGVLAFAAVAWVGVRLEAQGRQTAEILPRFEQRLNDLNTIVAERSEPAETPAEADAMRNELETRVDARIKARWQTERAESNQRLASMGERLRSLEDRRQEQASSMEEASGREPGSEVVDQAALEQRLRPILATQSQLQSELAEAIKQGLHPADRRPKAPIEAVEAEASPRANQQPSKDAERRLPRDANEAEPAQEQTSATTSTAAPAESGTPVTGDELASAPATGASPNRADQSRGTEAIMLKEPKFALQLIGLRSRKALRSFIDAHGLYGRGYVREENYLGRPWYALIYSLHDDQDAAATAQAGLPEEFSGLDIWLRPLQAGTRLLPVMQRPQP